MLRDCSFALVAVLCVALSCVEVRGQAPPSRASSSSAQVQTPAPTQSAPPAQESPTPTNPSSSSTQSPTQAPVPHTISVSFDYDFDRTPACTEKITRRCVQKFVIYDISSGANHAYPIGTVALPDHPYGQKRAIPGKTDPHVLNPAGILSPSPRRSRNRSRTRSNRTPSDAPVAPPGSTSLSGETDLGAFLASAPGYDVTPSAGAAASCNESYRGPEPDHGNRSG